MRTRWNLHWLVSLAAVFIVWGCSSNEPTLQIELVTDLVPGPEFRVVETSVRRVSGTGAELLHGAEAQARFGTDFARGQRVASFEVVSGDYDVRLRLMRPNGVLLVEQHKFVSLHDNYVLRVHVTRDCTDVQCPHAGGSLALTACLNGQCVDPRCTLDAPEFCPPTLFCNDVSECSAVAECATRTCDEGICISDIVENSCDDTMWCNPEAGLGCQPLIAVEPDFFPCGTICTSAAEPCRFGYWRCNEDEAPFCEPLLTRPMDYSCAPERVCDAQGDCIEATTPGIVVTPTSGLETTEAAGTAVFNVSMRTAPSENVYLMITTNDPGEATASPGLLTFTPENALSPQAVEVTGIDDADRDGAQAFTIAIANLTSAGDYTGLVAPSVTGTNLDNETTGIVVRGADDAPLPLEGLTTTENGGTATFSVVLISRPTTDVIVPVVSSNEDEGAVFPGTVTFTPSNWNVRQVVTLTGVDDGSIVDGDQAYLVHVGPSSSDDIEYNALAVSDVQATNIDNDAPGLVVAPPNLFTSEGGGDRTFTVRLQSQPSAGVDLTITSSDLSEGTVSPATLSFGTSDWNTPRMVTVSSVDDTIVDGNQSYGVVFHVSASADSNYASLSDLVAGVNNADDDTAGIQVSRTAGLATSESGTSDTFEIVLTSTPSSDVTIALSSDTPSEGVVSPSSVTFTPSNWATPQTITATGVDDVLADGPRGYTVVTAPAVSTDVYNGVNASNVTATNDDNDTPSVLVTPTSGLITSESGATATFSVVLQVAPTANVTITLASGNVSEGSVSPSSITFTPGDWSTPRIITVTGVDDASFDGSVAYSILTSTTSSSSAPYNGVPVSDVSVTNVDNEAQLQAVLAAANSEGGDSFGFTVDVSSDGNTLVVGAPFERSNATGINGDGSNNAAPQSGAAYVFVRTGTSWAQQAYVKASNTDAGDYFGLRVAVSDDGNTVAVGAKFERSNATGINGNQANNAMGDSGAVYVFTRDMTTWTQQAYIKASHATTGSFGCALGLSGDGNTLAVGAQYDGHGTSGINSNEMIVGGTTGSAYVFTRAGMTWSQEAFIKASNPDSNDFFGSAIAISEDGSTLVVSTYAESSSSTGINGNQADNSRSLAGAAYLFSRVGTMWSQQAYIKASNTDANDQFGNAVALSADGNTLAVGAYYESSATRVVNGVQADNSAPSAGAVYVFTRSGMTWSQEAYVKSSMAASGHYFGDSIALSEDGNRLLATAPSETGVPGTGAFYVFGRTGATWTQALRIPSATGSSVLGWGQSVMLSSDGSTIIVGGYNTSYPDGIVNVYVTP